jgi:hypothetical protein
MGTVGICIISVCGVVKNCVMLGVVVLRWCEVGSEDGQLSRLFSVEVKNWSIAGWAVELHRLEQSWSSMAPRCDRRV